MEIFICDTIDIKVKQHNFSAHFVSGHGYARLQPRPHLAQPRRPRGPRAWLSLGSGSSRASPPSPASAPSPPPLSPRAPLTLSLPELLLGCGLLLLTRLLLTSAVIHRQDQAWWVLCYLGSKSWIGWWIMDNDESFHRKYVCVPSLCQSGNLIRVKFRAYSIH